VNVGISVSRVGGNAQTKAMKKVAGRLRLDLAQYRELAAFAQFGSDLDEATQAQLRRGSRTMEVLKQGQYAPVPMERQVMIIWVATNGYLDDLELGQLRAFEDGYYPFMEKNFPEVSHTLAKDKVLSDDTVDKLKRATKKYKEQFVAEQQK
jgi:F-type H+-transporting ATPase subunit alpha